MDPMQNFKNISVEQISTEIKKSTTVYLVPNSSTIARKIECGEFFKISGEGFITLEKEILDGFSLKKISSSFDLKDYEIWISKYKSERNRAFQLLGSSLLPDGKLFGKLPICLLSFKEEWKLYSKTGDGLFSFLNILKAPYGFIEHCVDLFEMHLMSVLKNFSFVHRGSIKRKVALKGGADIDLDIILPRSFLSKEGKSEF
jgi:hypothetical protein